jgi:hypothetical protein
MALFKMMRHLPLLYSLSYATDSATTTAKLSAYLAYLNEYIKKKKMQTMHLCAKMNSKPSTYTQEFRKTTRPVYPGALADHKPKRISHHAMLLVNAESSVTEQPGSKVWQWPNHFRPFSWASTMLRWIQSPILRHWRTTGQ